MVFITEGFFEVAIESLPEWDLNPRPLKSSANALKILSIKGCHQKIKYCFLMYCLVPPSPNLTLMCLIKKLYAYNDTAATNLATNVRVVFKLFIVNYHINFKNMIHIQI